MDLTELKYKERYCAMQRHVTKTVTDGANIQVQITHLTDYSYFVLK